MTDNEIIKALEVDALSEFDHWVIDLINRQNAEIKRLRNILLKFMDEVAKWEEKKGIDVSELPLIPICDEGRDIIDHYRAQAIRQFAERLKERKYQSSEWSHGEHPFVVEESDIDDLVEEMAGAE